MVISRMFYSLYGKILIALNVATKLKTEIVDYVIYKLRNL